jgi:two-component system cell cycle sensor histidine kinase/response regulator CckA
MTIVNGYGEILLRKLPVTDPSRGAAEQIKRAGDRAAEVARQLLAFSRKQVLSPIVLDLNAVVVNVAKMLRAVVGEDVELVTDLERGLWPVRVDPGQMEQVLVNLAANARDAMPGGGKLTIRTANRTRTATAGQHSGPGPDSDVTLSVSDSGCGMDEQTRKHLFEPFFTTKDIGKGTGLGLATVHGIIMQSNGSITVESVPGCGSTFHIYLPASQKLVPSKKRPSGTRRIPQGVATVLLVEDEKEVRGLAHLALETAGYRVLEAENGEEALRVASQSAAPFHLLVTDVIMPRMNGKQLAERLAARQPDLRVLFLSGYSADVLNQKSLLGEGAAFLQKPYTPTTLVQKVHALLDSNDFTGKSACAST